MILVREGGGCELELLILGTSCVFEDSGKSLVCGFRRCAKVTGVG